MNHDEVSKLTTPNAIRQSSEETLDGLYNEAVGYLRHADEGVIRQMQVSIKSIQDEKLLRWNKSARKISIISLIISILVGALSIGKLLCTGS